MLFRSRCTSAAAVIHDVGSVVDCHRRAVHFPVMASLVLAGVGITVAIVASGIGMTIGPTLDRSRDSSGSFDSIITTLHATAPNSENSTACNLLNSTYNGTTSLPDYESVSKMFREICTSPDFIELSQTWAENFTLSYGTQHGYGTVFYSFIWVAACSISTYGTGSSCTYQEYWAGNLTTNNVTGPYIQEEPLVYNEGGSQGSGAGTQGGPFSAIDYWLVLAGVAVVVIVAGTALLVRRHGQAQEEELTGSATVGEQAGAGSMNAPPQSATLVSLPREVEPDEAVESATDTLEDLF